jgi:hypothetical protein
MGIIEDYAKMILEFEKNFVIEGYAENVFISYRS